MFSPQTPQIFSPHQLTPPFLTQMSQSQSSQYLFSLSSSQPSQSPVPPLRQPKKECGKKVSVQFSDPSCKLNSPERSMFLKTISDMDPNDINSITRDRDYNFLKNLYTKVTKEYNFAMGKWKTGTGGGPSRPENYNDREQRDGEAFITYGYKVREKYVEKDRSMSSFLILCQVSITDLGLSSIRSSLRPICDPCEVSFWRLLAPTLWLLVSTVNFTVAVFGRLDRFPAVTVFHSLNRIGTLSRRAFSPCLRLLIFWI